MLRGFGLTIPSPPWETGWSWRLIFQATDMSVGVGVMGNRWITVYYTMGGCQKSQKSFKFVCFLLLFLYCLYFVLLCIRYFYLCHRSYSCFSIGIVYTCILCHYIVMSMYMLQSYTNVYNGMIWLMWQPLGYWGWVGGTAKPRQKTTPEQRNL